jgi:[CysO sulfur-carrier protein]-S-L-cysteine hydrolase
VAAPARLILSQAQQQQIFEHCMAERPNEACGLLAGRGERIHRVFPARNKEQSPVRYEIEPADLIRIFHEIEDDDLELVGIFHSHVYTQAYPSQTDIRLAYYPDALYVLVSLLNERQPLLRAFTIVDGQVNEVEVVEADAKQARA